MKSEKLLFLCILAGISRLRAALVTYHASLYPETAELLVAAFGLHAEKSRCCPSTVTAASSTTAVMHPKR